MMFQPMDNYKYSVLTFIFGKGYEVLHEIMQKPDDVEFICVTDDRSLESNTWDIVYDDNLAKLSSPFEKCFNVRYNPFKYCHSSICMTVDGSVQINRFPYALLENFTSGNYDICLMPHPFNCDFLSEYKMWIIYRKYDTNDALKFFDMISKTHYDLKYRGLFQLCFSIKKNTFLTSQIDSMVFSFLKYLSTNDKFERLDQTVYSYVLNTWFSKIKVLPVSEQIVRSSYMTWFKHGSSTIKNLNAFYDINKPDMRYMFNELVECQYLLD